MIIEQELIHQQDGTIYVPFSDVPILESPTSSSDQNLYVPFEEFSLNESYKEHKCQYCKKPDYHANCHAHEKWCPLSCHDENPIPIGSNFLILSLYLIIFTLFKKFRK